MTLAARDTALRELMDDPACDPVRLDATLRRFDLVNRLVSGWGTVYRTRLRSYLRGLERPARVLDLGCGGGDLVRRLAAATARDGLAVTVVGADPDPRAHRVATSTPAPPNAAFVCADAAALVARGERFDAVVSNHVLHHLDDALPAVVAASAELARGPVLHGDIARGRLAYGLYAVGITPLAPGTFLRTDGLRSIRRSFTPAELRAALAAAPGRWTVSTPAPFRVLAEGSGRA